MNIEVKGEACVNIDIDSYEAFRILCETLDMEFVLSEDDFIVKTNEFNEKEVFIRRNGVEEIFDSRGDLFVALRNVAVNIFPNVEFRGDAYIY